MSEIAYFDLPYLFQKCEIGTANTALIKLKEAIKSDVDFDNLVNLSVELRIPLNMLSRPESQCHSKTHIAAPVEIWWKGFYTYTKIGIGNTLEAAVEEAKQYILSHKGFGE